MAQGEGAPAAGDKALTGSNYDVIRKRLLDQAQELGKRAEALNVRRKQLFGGRELALVETSRIRTENNCIPRDVVSVSGHLLFGFQVFVGLKSETTVKDIFSLHRFAEANGNYDFSAVPFEGPGAFLADATFDKELRDVFRYSKNGRLLQLRRTDSRLVAVVQIGESLRDIRVFRFAIDAQGRVVYMDARGEEDYVPPPSHAFEWTVAGRENQVSGRHPHMNILNEVFVETVNGDLTVKIENNTEDGLGIYREPVADPNQTLDDAEIAYAKLGGLILLKIKPFREDQTRYLVFNTRTDHVLRVDALGTACVELPEDQGIIFPGGYYLQTGEHKVFDKDVHGLRFERALPSPNGEDVLYVFYREEEGEYALLPYNLIRKEVQNPIRCHGYSLFSDGTMVVFRQSPAEEPTRVHPVQVWRTPFTTTEFAASAPTDGSYLSRVGNADLVTGISEALSMKRLAEQPAPTRRTFEDLTRAARRVIDTHYWLGHAEAEGLLGAFTAIAETSALIVDEFEKALAVEKRAREAVADLARKQEELLSRIRPGELEAVEPYLAALTELKKHRGHLITLKDLRAVDLARIGELEAQIVTRLEEVSRSAVMFFVGDDAWKPLLARLDAIVKKVPGVDRSALLAPLREELDTVQQGLELLTEIVSGLKVDDVTARTRILDGASSAFAQQNRARAILDARHKELSTNEGRAEFGVQFKLLGQSVTSALALATTPAACDEQLARLMLQLEELEGRFGELEEFSPALADKREEVLEAVAARRQLLEEERQRRAQSRATAADRILAGVARRAQSFGTADELNAYFASDPMIQKVQELRTELLELGSSVRADEIDSKLKTARQSALRALRDKTDLSDGDANVVRFGAHRFHVNTQPLELSIVPREGALHLHLTGTDFYEAVTDPILEAARDLWDQQLVSESPEVYRGEFLAVSLLREVELRTGKVSAADLSNAVRDGKVLELVRTYAEDRIDEGYERGVHDADAARILETLLSLERGSGLLRYSPASRGAAWLYWHDLHADQRNLVERRAQSAVRMNARLMDARAEEALAEELSPGVQALLERHGIPFGAAQARLAARYLVAEIGAEHARFTSSARAAEIEARFLRHLEEHGLRQGFEEDLRALEAHPVERLGIALSYLDAFLPTDGPASVRCRLELAARLLWDSTFDRVDLDRETQATVGDLLGAHPRITGRAMPLAIDEIRERVGTFIEERAPRHRTYRKQRNDLAVRERARLRIDEFSPRVLSSFVRNKLIDDVYLPLIGANLAKQLGAAGGQKRTDLMGLLLLVSPPGYGKTTLMEYIASRLGLAFMKVNGPALGAEVRSLDPAEAPNATARQEVEKINLALEMGQNVMLYLDDIQHTDPELLQKFISLCDAQRRIEGVWKGRTRTYDLRGKKFCICMAGNPYTESGARFQIPDMLANRADTYNLGDILDGKADAFATSYLENALTSNSVLAPLAGREPGDVYKLLAMAKGQEVPPSALTHQYSASEVEELIAVFRRLFTVQSVLLRVNQEYIASASQDDRYRTEPPFKLQGSYRNMNKLAEKVASAMNEVELERLIDDHYASESQTLTKGAEQNLLKLAEMRGKLTDAERARWTEIKDAFARIQRMGGKDDDPVARLTGSLAGLDDQLKGIRDAVIRAASGGADRGAETARFVEKLGALAHPKVEVALNTTDNGLSALLTERLAAFERTLAPLLGRPPHPPGASATRQDVALDARLAGITDALAGLRQLLEQGGTGARRFDVTLEPASATNFWKPLSGTDVCTAGGLYVATYEKPPPLGARVLVSVAFPAGERCEFPATVHWVQDELGDHSPPGFGVQLADPPAEVRRLIEAYAATRDPLLRDD